MNYTLNKAAQPGQKTSAVDAFKKLWPLLAEEKRVLAFAAIAIGVNSGLTLVTPLVVGHAIDTFIVTKQFGGVLASSGILLGMYLVILVAQYLQTTLMGGVGQRTLFRLRNAVFNKLQELPVAFFNANRAGDLISRINNDTDKLNQFFSQSLMQFLGNAFVMLGAGVFLIALNPKLGGAALIPAFLTLLLTQLTSGWVKQRNAKSMKALGGMSGEIQESLANFKVIIAFDRRDYFRERFAEANKENYDTSVRAGIANNIFTPIYQMAQSMAQLIVLAFGIALIASGNLSIGLLVSYLAYINNFYNPMRQLAAFWANYQTALAGWDRIAEILSLETDLQPTTTEARSSSSLLEFRDVAFHYTEGKDVIHDLNFTLERGKTYALVGPTGGGKTTTASLMARLFDPTSGTVFLDGKDIRAYSSAERTKKVGFILQEPFLFNGTVRDNVVYSNEALANVSSAELEKQLKDMGLSELLVRFDKGLDTPASSGDGMSLGQKQLIAFIRAMLRKPELLILDEATANIDTITEQLLEDVLDKLPAETTRVVIAHRLNTIETADEIFFVNGGSLTRAGSLQDAVDMLLHGKRAS